MKAISLWQPWATFMHQGLKFNETRSWPTNHRGALAICSAKRSWRPSEFGPYVQWLSNGISHIWHQENKFKRTVDRQFLFPKGFVLCVVDLIDCRPTDGMAVNPLESMAGNYEPGRFAWITRNCRCLKQPVPVIGRQGIFNLPPAVEVQVRAQL